MKTSFAAALLTASILGAPAFAQSTIVPMPPAPPPTASGPPMATGIPASPLTADDTQFVRDQLEGNLAEIAAGQMALQRSQDQNIRNYAQKMVTDHTAANETLLPIANAHNIPSPATVDPRHQAMLDQLTTLSGPAFDRAYIDAMIRSHDEMIAQLNNQLIKGQSPVINVWVQNTRPVVLQHDQLAQQIKTELPRTG